eukprot:scaffold215298_cov27-Tisochrysis_lutea.AAC.1
MAQTGRLRCTRSKGACDAARTCCGRYLGARGPHTRATIAPAPVGYPPATRAASEVKMSTLTSYKPHRLRTPDEAEGRWGWSNCSIARATRGKEYSSPFASTCGGKAQSEHLWRPRCHCRRGWGSRKVREVRAVAHRMLPDRAEELVDALEIKDRRPVHVAPGKQLDG